MDVQTIAMICAGIGVVSTVVYHVINYKKLKTLREIKDHVTKR